MLNRWCWLGCLVALLPAAAFPAEGTSPPELDAVLVARRRVLERSPRPLTARRFARPFYFSAQGPYDWFSKQGVEAMKQVGMAHELVQGYLSLRHFQPEANVPNIYRQLAARFLQHRWPFYTIDYDLTRGEPLAPLPPEGPARELWLGASHPEELYRLEPFFYYVRQGKRWPGSSMGHWTDEGLRKFMEQRVLPRVRRELPFYAEPEHRWTRSELKRLTELLADAYWEDRTPVVWQMSLSPYFLAARPDVRTIGTKGCSALDVALARGLLRHADAHADYLVWLGFEPTERHHTHPLMRAGIGHRGGRALGLPKELLTIYYLRPYLSGAAFLTPEGCPMTGIGDVERDGQFELTPVGRVFHRLLDLAHRYPDRGTAWVPIALLLDREREIGLGGTTYGLPVGLSRLWSVPYDDADQFNHGLIKDVLFPEPPATRWTAGYFRAAPFGELFAIVRPNEKLRSGLTPERLLEPFCVAFSMGGLRLERTLTTALKGFVRSGGTLVVHAPDVLAAEDPRGWRELTGVVLHGELLTGRQVSDSRKRTRWDEKPFRYHRAELIDARVLYQCDGHPLVTVKPYGKGQVILLCTHYAVQADGEQPRSGHFLLRRYWKQQPVLKLVGKLIAELTAAVTPLRVAVPEAARPYMGWEIRRRGENWLAVVYNYDVRRDVSVESLGVAHSYAVRRPARTPIRLLHHGEAHRHVLEWLGGERLKAVSTSAGQLALATSVAAGEVRVYEFSPRPLEPPPPRWQNLARGKPVRASSSARGLGPELAVDGRREWHRYWCSAPKARAIPRFPLPQWLELDLEQVRRINHTRVYMHWEPDDDLDAPLKVYRYRIEVSRDGKTWQTVVDETKNLNPARPHGDWRWFDPVEARYVRLVITDSLNDLGARVVELEVYDATTPGLAELPAPARP